MTLQWKRWAGAAGAAALAGALALAGNQPSAGAAPVSYTAVLSASNEVGVAAGDAHAGGVADVTVDATTNQLCVTWSLTGFSGVPSNAYLYNGMGAQIATLPTSNGCTTILAQYAQSFSGTTYWVGVTTAASPDGAARGALLATVYSASLAGTNEVPGPGDPDGTGSAVFSLDATTGRACVVWKVANVALPATGAHIHVGGPGVAGPVVIPFSPPTAADWSECVTASADAVAQIAANPGNFYANVHNAAYPSGAARGQLAVRAGSAPPTSTTTSSTTTTAPPSASSTTTTTSTTVPGPATTVNPPPIVIVVPGPTTSTTSVATTTTAAPTATAAPATTSSTSSTTSSTTSTTTTTTVAPSGVTATPASPATPEEATPSFTG